MRITQVLTFEAAHWLPGVPKTHKCSRMHGHSYRVELTFDGPVDSRTGFVIDYFDIEKMAAPLLEQLDHHILNDVKGLENPTVEHIAQWFLVNLPQASAIRVYETPTSWAEDAR